MIRVLVVDDSAFMRKAISTMLEKDPDIHVVDTARNGEEGLEKVRRLDPDVVTMDIEMPRMDGLTALKHIMMEMPRPVLMISSLTTEGAEATFKAMEAGAVDFIAKRLSLVSLDIVRIEDELRAKVKAVARRRMRMVPVRRKRPVHTVRKSVTKSGRPGRVVRDIVAIGVSTGGPPVVQKILSELPADFPACILIAQHMPRTFTGPFAKRLNDSSPLDVKEAGPGDVVRPGKVFVAPGGSHLKIKQRISHIDVVVDSEPEKALYKPSVNELMGSVAQAVGRRGLGVILTGMGSDGCEGIKKLKERGGTTIAQSNETCVVYGMPKAIVEAGLADQIVSLDDMSSAITQALYASIEP
ncbi:protein-glutamate methylesterase/protein-glutamine glutaminase [Desulfoplanes formicivorans]|uniref:Protein-glutamate methylesterase/protein-glutamine glutaminase n=1 Tax=Desulfoplanes formicivorans TaxID=1592317 RepID=A0A194AMD5_9BACT|nr:chemotaxis response regulator protein-glutamate methylesterase [Desulfoplanes formicivorans]GAU09799.1 chemotaxis protein CheY [Desulfoplanes formicivorans]